LFCNSFSSPTPLKITKNVPFLPLASPSVDFGLRFVKNVLVFLASDDGNFGEIDFFPIADDQFFRIEVLVFS
jgi:hypothetical protein